MIITPEQQILAELTDQLKLNTEMLDIASSVTPELSKSVESLLTQNQELIQRANQKIDEIKQSSNL